MERRLVSIQVIDSIAPIEGADNIVQARVMGWTVVVKKGEFAPGDRCVFFEIDSLLPDGQAWSEFMRPRGFRVRTLKLRGVLSQGLALPVSIVGGELPDVGVDIRERLGVAKYEPALPDSREIAGPFPGDVPKTDEIRLQSALGVLDEIRGREFYVTAKVDGSSATYVRGGGELVACSRNWALAAGANPVWRVAAKYDLAARLPAEFAIQGEVCGPGIQKNRLGLAVVDLFVFSAYDVRRPVPGLRAARGVLSRARPAHRANRTRRARRRGGRVPARPRRLARRRPRLLRRDQAAARGHRRATDRRDAVGDAGRPPVLQGHQQRLPAQGRGLKADDPLMERERRSLPDVPLPQAAEHGGTDPPVPCSGVLRCRWPDRTRSLATACAHNCIRNWSGICVDPPPLAWGDTRVIAALHRRRSGPWSARHLLVRRLRGLALP